MQKAILRYYPRPVNWRKYLPFAQTTKFHFKLESKKAIVCCCCKSILEPGHPALLADVYPYAEKKKSPIWQFKRNSIDYAVGCKSIKNPVVRCPKCWNNKKGIGADLIHHRVLIGNLKNGLQN